ncbi:MAG: hypothetical protein JXX29_11885 [Deltaproteobacteria bacterium]|nr:hypothetical protein [Deltaproteobacteria bacterium]
MIFRNGAFLRIAGTAAVLALCCIWCCIWLFGCDSLSAPAPDETYDGPVNKCITNSNCPEGTCNKSLSICTVEKIGNDILFAKVILDSVALPAQIFSVPLESTSALQLHAQAPVPVTDISTMVDADVLFAEISNTLPNKDPDVFVYKTVYADNEFTLLPGEYNVSLYPVGTASFEHPVYHMGQVEIQADGTVLQSNIPILISFPYTNSDGYDRVSGQVLYENTSGDNSEIDNLYIQAFAPDTGQILSRGRELTCIPGPVGTGTTVCSSYLIPIIPGTTDIGLRLYKPNEPFYPVYIKYVEPTNVTDQSFEIPRLDTPVLVQGEIVSNSFTSGASPVPRCRLLFERLNDDNRALSYWVNTNDRGVVERIPGADGVYLYPGEYRITAYPIQDGSSGGERYSVTEMESILRVSNTAEDIDEESDVQVNQFSLVLDERLEITGDLIFIDELVPNATIMASNIETQHPYILSQKTVSNADGLFNFWLDKAIYYVIVQAPEESRYAVGTGIWNVRQSKTLSFTGRVQTPFLIAGTLDVDGIEQDSQSIDLGSVSIEWYKQFGQNAYLVARSAVESDGSFNALLPPN